MADLCAIAPSRIDWFRVLVDLERSGLAQEETAAAVGLSRQQVNNYKRFPGMEPKFHVGLMLLGLWAERKPGTALPLVEKQRT